ncbi:hypothetical protein Lal_00008175 [Lupinus albus]|uniref:Putative transcription factor WRKY family n=1 Tax=Lupinus albus TaxID=3870 RepID=A0A6A4PQC1_LUPAL|nr:putative transcription factor WRKY family [Lupinus albus]KAF1868368.1 hypothetical protein Lal_00008175 [Lupinus albus]
MENGRKAFEELVRGHEFAKQLRQIINIDDNNNISNDDESVTVFAQYLVTKVLNSFTNTLFLFNKYPSYQSHHHIKLMDSSSSITPSKPHHDTIKDRRGCYKRRRTAETTEEVSETPTIDNHQWRKYGQKPILNAKYSRNYYRCSYKLDQGCQATKQVQRVQEKPPLYKTIYCGHHTCKDPDIILDNSSPSHHSSIFLISFDNTKQDVPFLSSSFTSPSIIKRDECNRQEFIPFDDYLNSPHPTLDAYPMHVTQSSTLEFDQSLDVMAYGSVEHSDDLFQFIG